MCVCVCRSWDAWARIVQPIASVVPYMTLPGNHEAPPFDVDTSFSAYMHRLPMPWARSPHHVLQTLQALTAPGASLQELPRAFYSFDIGVVHIVMLDSETEAALAPGSPQYVWLVSDLER